MFFVKKDKISKSITYRFYIVSGIEFSSYPFGCSENPDTPTRGYSKTSSRLRCSGFCIHSLFQASLERS